MSKTENATQLGRTPGTRRKIGGFARQIACALIAVAVLIGAGRSGALAQKAHTHASTSQGREKTAEQKHQADTLIDVVRKATERFKDASVAQAAGYLPQFGCVSGPDSGAMGMHFVNGDLVNDGLLDPTRPEIVIYEPQVDGHLRLIGADFLVLADTWNATHSGPPELMGQLFHLFESPNRFGLPAFYTLHVWAWKESPTGDFVNWHSNVSCTAFNGQIH